LHAEAAFCVFEHSIDADIPSFRQKMATLDTLRYLHKHDYQIAQTKSPARGRARCRVERDA